ncbi:MAG: hypothetical protein D6722_11710 [Bacteroidetes bacterium]|nr:MAG: hypothetical protein D6722_11710 [Bacteroidota bacterium]
MRNRLLLLTLCLLTALSSQGQIARHHWLLAGQGRVDVTNVSTPGLRLRPGVELQPYVLYLATNHLGLGIGGGIGLTPAQTFPKRSLTVQPLLRAYLSNPEASWLWFIQVDPAYTRNRGDLVAGIPPRLQSVRVVGLDLGGGVGVTRFLSKRAGLELYGRFSTSRNLQPAGSWFFHGLHIRAGVFVQLNPLRVRWPEWDDE